MLRLGASSEAATLSALYACRREHVAVCARALKALRAAAEGGASSVGRYASAACGGSGHIVLAGSGSGPGGGKDMHESRQGYTEREGVVSDITVTFQVDAECSQRVIECYVINDVADGKTAVAADRKDLEEVFPGQDITVEGSKYLCLSLCETPNEECPLLSITESVTVYVPRGAFSRVAVCTLVKASQASEDRVMQRAIYDALICTAVGRAWREAGYPLIWSNVDV